MQRTESLWINFGLFSMTFAVVIGLAVGIFTVLSLVLAYLL